MQANNQRYFYVMINRLVYSYMLVYKGITKRNHVGGE